MNNGTATLTIESIGAPDNTTKTTHADADTARAALIAEYGLDHLRGLDTTGGTIGTNTGRVFQASHVWTIR